MCTAITLKNNDFYFGRNLDLERNFGEKVVITPRNYVFKLRNGEEIQSHYAMIGMASVFENMPLYAEAGNEKGLSMAGLNFPQNAVYHPSREDKINITPFELILWVLAKFANVREARAVLENVNLSNIPFSEKLPLSPLHWILSDEKESIVLESMEDGLHIYDNPIGVLTNNPPFPYHRENIRNYMNLQAKNAVNHFDAENELNLTTYGQGMGAIGLPGDFSSASRFVKAAFLKWNSISDGTEMSNVSQFFHILDAVHMVKGSVLVADHIPDITTYSSCINASKGIFYYKTYDNSQITAVQMWKADVDGEMLVCFELVTEQQVKYAQE